MSRPIDADALEKDGWMMHRIVHADKYTMSYQTKKPTDFPTIEPEPKWIPCIERLPKIGEEVLLSEPNAILIAEYHGSGNAEGLWLVDECHHYLADVNKCAWMPLPEPYREEGE